MKKSVLGLLLILFSSQSIGQDFDIKKLDQYFETLERNNKFMGSIALSHDGKIIYQKTVGYASVERNLLADKDTKYRIGSITKTFTAVLVLKAIEEKKLNLNQSIEKFFPDLPYANIISIEQLLRHRSGIHNFTDDDEYHTWNTEGKTYSQLLQIISQRDRDFEPNSRAAFSNSNYVLLTFVLENIYNKSYADLVTQYISHPLGLKNTYVGKEINPYANEALSYQLYDTRSPMPQTNLSIPLGAGNIVSTATDLVKFSDGLFTYKLLNKTSLEHMLNVQDHFGMGVIYAPFYNQVGYGHTGGIDSFSSVFSCFPESKLSYALVSNGTDFNTNTISTAVLSTFFNKEYPLPEFKETYTPTSDELNQHVGTYVSAELPLRITVTKANQQLYAQATGQASFPLEASDRGKFKFEPAGVKLEFYPTEQTMILKQAGGVFQFIKEK